MFELDIKSHWIKETYSARTGMYLYYHNFELKEDIISILDNVNYLNFKFETYELSPRYTQEQLQITLNRNQAKLRFPTKDDLIMAKLELP